MLPHLRRHGAGSALFEAASAWAAEQGVGELETVIDSSDNASLDFALHRGFHEPSREVVLELELEALPDVPGSDGWTPPSYEQFTKAHLRGPAIFVAVAGDEVVAYAKLNAGADSTSAEHGMTSVNPAWRRRGIAQSLKRAQIAWGEREQRRAADRGERRGECRHAAHQRGAWIPARSGLGSPPNFAFITRSYAASACRGGRTSLRLPLR